jgi:hypothetical protein
MDHGTGEKLKISTWAEEDVDRWVRYVRMRFWGSERMLVSTPSGVNRNVRVESMQLRSTLTTSTNAGVPSSGGLKKLTGFR